MTQNTSIYIYILVSLICVFIGEFVLFRSKSSQKRKYLIIFPVVVAGCTFVNWMIFRDLSFEKQTDLLTITALEEKNELSKDTSVYVTNIYVDGTAISIKDVSDSGWVIDGWVKWYSPTMENAEVGRSFSVEVKAGKERYVEFLGNEWKGLVEISFNGETQIVDCYSKEEQRITFNLPDSDINFDGRCLIGACLLLLIEVFAALYLLLRQSDEKFLKKNNALEFFRWVLCVIVILYHCTGKQFIGGYLGVDVFFVVSGYFLISHYSAHKCSNSESAETRALSYLSGRLKRVLPQHIFAYVCTVLVILLYTHGYTSGEILKDGWAELLLLRATGLGVKVSVSGVNWYLSALLILSYIIYYLLCKNEKQYLYIIAPLMFLTVMGKIYMSKGYLNVWTQECFLFTYGFWRGFAEMSLGCLCFVAVSKLKNKKISRKHKVLISMFEFVAWAVMFHQMWGGKDTGDFLVPVLAAVVVISMFSFNSYLTWLLDNPLSSYLGKLSFPMYLNHMIFVRALTAYYDGSDYSISVKIWAVIAIMIFSICSEWLISNMMKKIKLNLS